MPKHISKLPSPSAPGEQVILYHPDHGFWQCGMWMKRREDATLYINVNEAESVRALRGLPHDAEIVPASVKF